jgi:hypothetical protein
MKLEFSQNIQISNFMKIRLVEAELFHEDRRTHGRIDMTKLTVTICNFATARKNASILDRQALYGFSCMQVIFPGFQLTDSRDNLDHNYSTRGRPNTICFPTISNNMADKQNRMVGTPTLMF